MPAVTADAAHSKRERTALWPRSFSGAVPVAARANGVFVWDSEDHRYLDFAGSAAVNFIGHGDPDVAQQMADQAAQLEFVHTSQFSTQAAEDYAQELLAFAGEAFRGGAVYFTSGGSEAVETALKLARQYQVEIGHPERFQIVSRVQAYHGATLGALAVSGNRQRREMYLPMVRIFPQVTLPYCYRCQYRCDDCGARYAMELAAVLDGNEDVAASIFEPISGATLGAAVPPDGYLHAVENICRKHDVLIIADEVMTGMGRTGRNFACDHWAVAPDMIVAAKGLSSGYAPLGAVIASRKVVDAIANGSGRFTHGFTYNAHPVCVAAGRAVLRKIRDGNLVDAARDGNPGSAAHALKAALMRLRNCKSVGDVRGLGLLWGVEFVRDVTNKIPFAPELRFAAQVASAAAKRGVLVYPMQGCVDGTCGDHVLIAPPAVITADQVDSAVHHLSHAIDEATRSTETKLQPKPVN